MSDPSLGPLDPAAPGPEAIRQELERVLASAQFANAPSMGKMLRFVVEHALGGSRIHFGFCKIASTHNGSGQNIFSTS